MTFLAGIEALVYAYAFQRWLRTPLGAGFMVYACATITILYLADFFGGLWLASFAIHCSAALCAIVLLWSERHVLTGGRLFSIESKALMVSAALLFLFTQAALLTAPAQFHNWDEFSHWGTVIRTIFTADTFHLNPNPLYFQDYPPGLALFAYHVLKLTGFSEGNAYFAYVLLMGCLSASLLQLAARVSFARFAFSILVLWLCVEFIAEGWISVLIDHVLALFFMGCVSSCLLIRERGGPVLLLPVFVFAFALTKQAASSLALLATGIILADLLITHAMRERAGLVFWFRFCALAVCSVGAIWLAGHSWSAYVDAAGLERGWGSYSPYGMLSKVLGCCTTSREIDVARAFFGTFFGSDKAYAGAGPEGSLAYQAWLGLTAGAWSFPRILNMLGSPFAQLIYLWTASMAVALFASRSQDRWRTIAFACLMAAGAGGYSLSLLLAYLYSFSEYEALHLASFHRFFTVYLIAWLATVLVYFALAVPDPAHTRLRRFAYVGLSVVFIVLMGAQVRRANIILTPGAYHGYAAGLDASRKGGARDRVQTLVRPLISGISPATRVYILWPDDTGYEFWLTKYEMLPRLTNLVCFAVTSKPQPGFVQECAFSEAEFRNTLSNYDAVFVGRNLDHLRQEYPGLFAALPSGEQAGLFKIEKGPVLKLSPMEP